MSDSASATIGSLGGHLGNLNATSNSTVVSQPTILSFLQDFDFLLLELKLVGGALGIIYIGAHASLRRPPSALAAKTKKGQKKDDDSYSQGLELSDAIWFPVLAAIILVGLYYLIQWLKDPAILNTLLRWYMSTVSIGSSLTLYSHGMEVFTSFLFPVYWRGRDGLLRKIDQKTRAVRVCDDAGNQIEGAAATSNPLPGLLALFAPSEGLRKKAWDLRDLVTRHWVLKFFAHGMGEETMQIKFSHVMALFLSLGTALVYFTTSWTFLSNMLGYGMCYGTFLLLSPTDFLIGSLVLWGLFFYDIFMVFYTPYMVTVATKLDVPIKLTYQAASRQSILGLGDIVIPGMVIGWALRLDLWMHYLRKIKYESTDLKIVEKDSTSGELITRSETKHKEVKALYINAKGNWGERVWARGTLFLSCPPHLPPAVAASKFRKTYFIASMVGYSLGMMVTLAMLLVFKRGQPALLYLVPGVLGSLLVTSLVRGEFKQLWTYTEDGSLDTVDVVVDLDAEGNAIKTIGKLEDGVVDTTKDKSKEDGEDKDKDAAKDAEKQGKKGHRVFSLSLDAASEDEDD